MPLSRLECREVRDELNAVAARWGEQKMETRAAPSRVRLREFAWALVAALAEVEALPDVADVHLAALQSDTQLLDGALFNLGEYRALLFVHG